MITKVIKLKLQFFLKMFKYKPCLQIRVRIRKLLFFISRPKHMYVGTQKNRLNETFLLSTQNTCLH